ncbi:DUF2188 domain-containing protein [uncultured Polaribacter sp.]|uniref:DUF2188 domain-containing protein n=1 Tax=uncultured Polaribacter sp. TaxID=174711 RepID=UPI00261A8FF8|nr:DUF2188 domain-containing protein [uncultured Polaribacter sp.]
MTKKSNHVVPSKERGGWAVKKSGSTRASKSFGRKEDAVKFARELSRRERTELYIHKKDGRIQDRNSYGKDPFPPKG